MKSMNREIYHHGIKGQKWGVRRYQNEDGSLTSLGKERYSLTPNYVSTPETTLVNRSKLKELKKMKSKDLRKLARETAYDADQSMLSGDVKRAAEKGRENAIVNNVLDNRVLMHTIVGTTAMTVGYSAAMYLLVSHMPD